MGEVSVLPLSNPWNDVVVVPCPHVIRIMSERLKLNYANATMNVRESRCSRLTYSGDELSRGLSKQSLGSPRKS